MRRLVATGHPSVTVVDPQRSPPDGARSHPCVRAASESGLQSAAGTDTPRGGEQAAQGAGKPHRAGDLIALVVR